MENVKFAHEVKGFETLTEREKEFFSVMFANHGTLYVKGRAGEGKSAIMESIARKLDYNYIDLRLSQCDELSVGLFPVVNRTEGDVKDFTFAIPDWAIEANKRPTIINFEELNRCRQEVMNAVLGILNEKAIGSFFKFNKSVLMCSTGNMGDSDGTVVNEMDAALKNRLITYKHSLTLPDWKEGYANEHVPQLIVSYLEVKPSELYKLPPLEDINDVDAFATPRSWANLGVFLKSMLGDDIDDVEKVKSLVQKWGHMYIGNTSVGFNKYLDNLKTVSYKQILSDLPKYLPIVKGMTRPQKTEILQEIKKLDFLKLKVKEVANLTDFLLMLEIDNVVGFMKDIINEHYNVIVKDGIEPLVNPEVKPKNNVLRMMLHNDEIRGLVRSSILPMIKRGLNGEGN
jgi:hypothetical protein